MLMAVIVESTVAEHLSQKTVAAEHLLLMAVIVESAVAEQLSQRTVATERNYC